MKAQMTAKQEMARLTLASVALLLVGLMTTPLMEAPTSSATPTARAANAQESIRQPVKPVIRKITPLKNARAKKSKRLVLARR